MVSPNLSLRVAVLSAFVRAFRLAGDPKGRVVAREAVSRPAVTVTSDYGVGPSFPGMR